METALQHIKSLLQVPTINLDINYYDKNNDNDHTKLLT